MSTTDATEARRQRGLAIASLCKLTRKIRGLYVVPSQSGAGSYKVWSEPEISCTCDDFVQRQLPCKHVFAAQFVESGEIAREPAKPTEEIPPATRKTVAPRPTYRQDWPNYDKAQTNEKRHFQALLADLCRGVPELPRKPGRGRKPIPLADTVFMVTFKVYSTFSARRFMCDLADACTKGHIVKTPHYALISDAMENPALTPILAGLIAESARPLRAVEVDFAVDSTGFATSRFVRWFDHKYGVVKQEYDWVKVSAMTGVKTNVVTAVEIDGRYAGDSPKFAPLVNATAARGFTLREVSADAAFASYDNLELVGKLGGMPFIAFPSNTTAAQGGLYAKMFHFYSLNRDEYLAHYHKRSNIESTFSMVKAKFGDALRSKTDTAMVNEALCKILCHNVCCLIQSVYELGITATFWQDEEDGPEAGAQPETPAETDIDQLVSMYEWV